MKLIATVNTEIFSSLVSVLTVCGGEVILHFSKTMLSIVVPQGFNQIAVWIGCSVNLIFAKYTINSKSDDIITLKCNSQQLSQALTNETSPTMNMLLKKHREGTVLEFDQRSNDTTKQLIQRVAATILSPRMTETYQEPEWGTPSVSVKLPNIRQIMNWVNEMKEINPLLTLKANKEGEFKMRIESDSISVETTFPGLDLVGQTELATMEEAEALVDMKKFKKILKVGNIQGCVGEIHIYDQVMAKFVFTINSNIPDQPTSLTYILNATTKPV